MQLRNWLLLIRARYLRQLWTRALEPDTLLVWTPGHDLLALSV